MTLVSRIARRQLTAAMALAMALALLLGNVALAQTPGAVEIDDACDGVPDSIDFPDIQGNTFESEIKCLAWYEITQGTSEGKYEPNRKVTRWQMALFIYRLAQYMDEFVDKNLPAPSDAGFTDIDGVDPEAQDAINVLFEANVVKGKNSTTYAPYEVVRRDQMASFINRLQEWATGSTHAGPGEAESQAYGYPDVKVDNVHGTNIEDLTNVGIVQGKKDGKYHPAEGVSRGQMAAFIIRDVEINVDNDVIEPKEGEVPVDGITGVVTEVDTTGNSYTFVPNGESDEVEVDYEPGDVFYVDGESASNAAFEADIEPGDVIEYEDRGDDPSAHALTNTDVESGFIGSFDTTGNTVTVINTVSGDDVETFAYGGDLFTVDGDPVTETAFEASLNEGDNIEVEDKGETPEIFHLTNETLSGMVDELDGTADTLDVKIAAGAIIDGISFAGADSYTVDGEASNAAGFEGDLSVGDSVTYAVNSDGIVSFSLVNGAPTTVTGLAVADTLADEIFDIVNEDGPDTIDYSGDPPAGDEKFFVDGELVTQSEFEGDYTAGDSISFTEGSDTPDQDRVIALTNQVLRGEPSGVDTTLNTVNVLGPDDSTVLDAGAYTGDELNVNGSEVDEPTFEAYLVAVEDGVIDGYLEVDLDETPESFNIVVED